jgi:ComF family protein
MNFNIIGDIFFPPACVACGDSIARGAGGKSGAWTVTPVPLSRERARARGFNQSALIARPLARALGAPFDEHILARIAHRKPQSDTEDIFERRENIKGCFALAPGADVQNKKIVLVDDVTTSGTTLAAQKRYSPSRLRKPKMSLRLFLL